MAIPILFTIPNFITAGSGRAMLNIIERLDRQKFAPSVCVMRKGGALDREVENLGIPLIEAPFTVGARPYHTLLQRARRAAKVFRPHKFGLWHSFHYSDDYTEPIIARMAGTKNWIYTKKNMSWGSRAWRVRSFLAKRIVAQNTEMMEKFFPGKEGKVVLIPSGVDIQKFHPDESSSTFRTDWQFSEKSTVIGHVGQYVPIKNQAHLLRALAITKSDLRLVLAGDVLDQPYAASLSDLVSELRLQDRVRFLGKVKDIPKLLRSIDIFAFCSHHEGLGIALLEAMANGLPCVVNDIPAMEYIHNAGKTALMVPRDDVGAFAAALDELATNEGKRRQLGQAARKRIEETLRLIEKQSLTKRYTLDLKSDNALNNLPPQVPQFQKVDKPMLDGAEFKKRLIRRLTYWADWRCVEPVVVFESDDWGLLRKACSDYIKTFAIPGERADEEIETPEDLRHLYEVMGRHVDSEGTLASLTANFIVANPDYDALFANGFTSYVDKPIGEMTELKGCWLEGMKRKVFLPQYHGRSHFWPPTLLRDLRDDAPHAREMGRRGYHGGLSLVKGAGWSYHSEYRSWFTGEERAPADLRDWLQGGLTYFKDCFGFFPRSLIAPHYILTPSLAEAWQVAGGEFVQATNNRIVPGPNGQLKAIKHILGERSAQGLTLMGRTVKFEPRPERPRQAIEFAIEQIKDCFASKVPAVIDTHRINYTGNWRKQALQLMDDLLTLIKAYRPRFLTTVELGEAIAHEGVYQDVWTGEKRKLTPINPPWRRLLRTGLHPYNASLAANSHRLKPVPEDSI